MSREELHKNIDNVLELLSKPLSRHILSVLAGIDPGIVEISSEDIDDESQDTDSFDSH